eukprot:7917806-Heterocapsa_arctica.AAC.1
MAAGSWRDGDGYRERGGYPPYRQERLPWHDQPQLRFCRTCDMSFLAVPEQRSGYMHKNCC